MEWIYIGIVLNTIMTAGFPTEEACLGHKVMLEKQQIVGACIKAPRFISAGTDLGITNCMVNSCLEYH